MPLALFVRRCLRFAQGIINEGFGQRGAFASIQEVLEKQARARMVLPQTPFHWIFRIGRKRHARVVGAGAVCTINNVIGGLYLYSCCGLSSFLNTVLVDMRCDIVSLSRGTFYRRHGNVRQGPVDNVVEPCGFFAYWTCWSYRENLCVCGILPERKRHRTERPSRPVDKGILPAARFFLATHATLALFSLVVSYSQEHLAGHPMFVPRGARKRVLALAELIRLQMKAESDKGMTTMEVRRR